MQASTTAAAPASSPGAVASISIALAGSGGSGVMTAGTLLLAAAAKAGLYGLMVRTSGPQIRGGEAAALVRLARVPIDSLDDRFDVLLAIDWQNVNRFADEIPLAATSVMVGDPDEGEPPEVFKASGARYFPLPFKKTAKGIPGSWTNMVALGLAGALAGIAADALEAALRDSWKRSDEALEGQSRGAARGHRRGGADRRRSPASGGGEGRPDAAEALADQRQRGGGLRRDPRRRALRRRVSDHAGDRAARMDGAGARQGRRHAAAGRGRARVGQHDHRRVLRRRAVAHRDRRSGARADDRGHRPRRRGRGADRRRRRDARRPLHRHSRRRASRATSRSR